MARSSPTANTAYTLHTPAGGKSFYVVALSICVNGANQYVRVGDDISGNATTDNTEVTGFATHSGSAGGTPEFITFPVPWKISTALNFISSNTQAMVVAAYGYEV